MEIVIGLLVGLAAGLVITALGRRQIAPLQGEAARLRAELDAVRPEIEEHRLAKVTAETQLDERSKRVTELEAERDDARGQLSQQLAQESASQAQLSEAVALSEERRKRIGELETERATASRLLATRVEQEAAVQAQFSESEALLLAVRAQAQTLTAERDEARVERDRLQQESSAVQAQFSESEASLQAIRAQAQTLTAERDEARVERGRLQQELSAAQAKVSGLEADHAARQEELETYRNELESRFKGIATNVTEATRNEFIKEFRDLSKQQSEASLELVGNTVKPLRESLEKLDQGTQKLEKTRVDAYADLRRSLVESNQAIGELRQEASGLRQALRSPQVRGLWGEQQLQNVLEASGLREHVDFAQQVDAGGGRPDVVVQIPGQRSVVIDAKTPLDSYLNALEAEDQSTEQQLLTAHANSLFNHSRSLGQKDYSRQIDDALDFVILFVPSDAILDAALRVRPDLFEQTWRQHRVLMAAPGSLIAFLRAVAQVWQQQTIQQNAVEIAGAAHELYERLGTYTDHLDKMGRSLGQAVNHYNRGVGSFQSRVLSSARKIEELSEIEESRRIDEPSPLEVDVREVTAAELNRASALSIDEPAEAVAEAEYEDIVGESYPETSETLEAIQVEEETSIRLDTVVDRRTRRGRPGGPRGFTLWGEHHRATSYRAVMQGVVEIIYRAHREDFSRAMEIRGRTRDYIARSHRDLDTPLRILDSPYWLEGKQNRHGTIDVCHRLLVHFGYEEADLIVHYGD